MSERLDFYVRSQLLGSGVAILHAGIAQKLSCGLWPSFNNASSDFRNIDAIVKQLGADCDKITVQADGKEFVVLARSISDLALRINQITGLCITADLKYKEPTPDNWTDEKSREHQASVNDIHTKVRVSLQEKKRLDRLNVLQRENQKHQTAPYQHSVFL